jgi:hypothetical protein
MADGDGAVEAHRADSFGSGDQFTDGDDDELAHKHDQEERDDRDLDGDGESDLTAHVGLFLDHRVEF